MPRPLAAALAVLALFAGGCGDDDGPDAAPDVTTGDDAAAPDEDDGAEVPADPATDEDPEGTSTTTAPDAAAEDPPGSSGGAGEGMGDPFVYVADLQAADVPGGGGDAGATGRVEIRAADGQLCTDLEVTGLGSDVTDAHVHEGAAGEVGDAVLPIGPPTGRAGETATWDDVCVPDDGLAHRLDTDASLFYADVHTGSHGDGAVRGQLGYATIFDLTLP